MKMKKTSLNTTKVTDRKIKRIYLTAATVVAAAFVMALPASVSYTHLTLPTKLEV